MYDVQGCNDGIWHQLSALPRVVDVYDAYQGGLTCDDAFRGGLTCDDAFRGGLTCDDAFRGGLTCDHMYRGRFKGVFGPRRTTCIACESMDVDVILLPCTHALCCHACWSDVFARRFGTADPVHAMIAYTTTCPTCAQGVECLLPINGREY
jgi:hypothetical protein